MKEVCQRENNSESWLNFSLPLAQAEEHEWNESKIRSKQSTEHLEFHQKWLPLIGLWGWATLYNFHLVFFKMLWYRIFCSDTLIEIFALSYSYDILRYGLSSNFAWFKQIYRFSICLNRDPTMQYFSILFFRATQRLGSALPLPHREVTYSTQLLV